MYINSVISYLLFQVELSWCHGVIKRQIDKYLKLRSYLDSCKVIDRWLFQKYFRQLPITGRKLCTSDLAPFLKMGVTLTNFHSPGKMPVSIQLLSNFDIDDLLISEVYRELYAALMLFFSLSWLNSSHTVLTLGAFKEKAVLVGGRQLYGSVLEDDISLGRLGQIVVKIRGYSLSWNACHEC